MQGTPPVPGTGQVPGTPLSPRNRRVRDLVALARRPAERRARGIYIVEGPKLVSAALQSSAELDELFVSADEEGSVVVQRLVGEATERGVDVQVLSGAAFERVSDARSPRGILATCRRLPFGEGHALEPGWPFVIVCTGVADPGNMGALLRVAAASGAGALVVCDAAVDPYGPKAVRASGGAVFSIPVVELETPEEALQMVHHAGMISVGTVPRGGLPYDEVSWEDRFALFVGSEGAGLGAGVESRMDVKVSIPMQADVESLNVAAAAAIVAFEAARRRRRSGGG